MKATYHPGIHKFSIFVVCWTALLLTAGALVTSKDAALSVSDWPTSFGMYFPPLRMLSGGAFYEHSHRVIAAILGIFIIILAVMLWQKEERPRLKWLGFLALAGVIFQGVLGGLTVIKLLHYWLPVMHACTAELMFAILVSIAFFTSHWWMENLPQYEDRGSPSIHSIVTFNAIIIFVQVLLGAGFRHQYISVKPHVDGFRSRSRQRHLDRLRPSPPFRSRQRNYPRPRSAPRHPRLANSSRHRCLLVAHFHRRRSPAHARHDHLHRHSHRGRRPPLRHLHHCRAFVLSSRAKEKGNDLRHHAR